MRMSKSAVLAIAISCGSADEADPARTLGQVAALDDDRSCIVGEGCRTRATCIDIADDCDPTEGGQECPGVCRSCDDPALERSYVEQSPRSCERIRLRCQSGQLPFSDACGCGCEPRPSAD